MQNPTVSVEKRSLKAGTLAELQSLIDLLNLNQHFGGDATVLGCDPLLRSPHRLAEATAYALLLEGIAAASIWKRRSGEDSSIGIELSDAIHALHSTHFLWQSGYPISVGAEYVPTNGIFECKDGRFIMIEAGPPYAKLERGYLNFFDCGNNRDSIARCIANFKAEDLQEKLSALGLPACIAYSPEEWRAHAQGKALLKAPVIEIEKIADGKPIGLTGKAPYPLAGIKVLDFTHVLAGPRSMRSLAQYGAEVLHISSPYHRDTISQNLLVNFGKRSAYLLLSEPDAASRMKELLKSADVLSFSYRPSVAERFGLEPATLAAGSDGIVCLSVNAYGHSGPWTSRPGFDQNAQVATGFAAKEAGSDGRPRFSPVFYLNDFLTAYLASAGVMTALLRRALEGGSYHVKVSLARSAMWVQDLGYINQDVYHSMPEKDIYPVKLRTVKTTCGEIKELVPAGQFSNMPRLDLNDVHPFGADPPEWIGS